jgi:hypothetical protein
LRIIRPPISIERVRRTSPQPLIVRVAKTIAINLVVVKVCGIDFNILRISVNSSKNAIKSLCANQGSGLVHA